MAVFLLGYWGFLIRGRERRACVQRLPGRLDARTGAAKYNASDVSGAWTLHWWPN